LTLPCKKHQTKSMRLAICYLVASVVLSLPGDAQVPVFQVTPETSSIKFDVKASVAIDGTFDKWDATLTFTSSDATTGVLNVRIDAASVNTGSGFKDDKLRSKDFFNVKHDPYITFKSTKVIPTGPDSADVQGIFTIRGVSKPETLKLTGQREANGGEIHGNMAFDRKDYGMTSGIPFIKIADHVEVDIALKVVRTSGPPVVMK